MSLKFFLKFELGMEKPKQFVLYCILGFYPDGGAP